MMDASNSLINVWSTVKPPNLENQLSSYGRGELSRVICVFKAGWTSLWFWKNCEIPFQADAWRRICDALHGLTEPVRSVGKPTASGTKKWKMLGAYRWCPLMILTIYWRRLWGTYKCWSDSRTTDQWSSRYHRSVARRIRREEAVMLQRLLAFKSPPAATFPVPLGLIDLIEGIWTCWVQAWALHIHVEKRFAVS